MLIVLGLTAMKYRYGCRELLPRLMSRYIVLKIPTIPQRSRIFVKSAFNLAGDNELVIAIGSASKGWESNNPWTLEERTAMVKSWLNEQQDRDNYWN